MNQTVYTWLKQFRFLRLLKRQRDLIRDRHFGFTILNIVTEFPSFIPRGTGPYKVKQAITRQTINNLFPAIQSLHADNRLKEMAVDEFVSFARKLHKSGIDTKQTSFFKEVLDREHSDKSNDHDYHKVYAMLFSDRFSVGALLEVGLGTDNPNLVSNMTEISHHKGRAKPGASVRAFAEIFPNAFIYGADIDKTILFNTDRIKTVFIDQTNPESFYEVRKLIGDKKCDLIIDDGLHSPDANIFTLSLGMNLVKPGGWIVIEDIGLENLPIWRTVASLLPSTIDSYFVECRSGYLFVVHCK
jgi:hypothetical protein